MQTKTSPLGMLVGSAFTPATIAKPSPEVQQLSTRMQEVDTELAHVRGVREKDFLPYEAVAMMQRAREKQKELEVERAKIVQALGMISTETAVGKIRYAMHVKAAEAGFPNQLDLTPLSMTGRNGPAFLVSPFYNRSGKCEITVRIDQASKRYRAFFKPALPQAIEALLQNGAKKLAENYSDRHKKVVVAASFGGYAGGRTSDILAEVAKAHKTGLFSQVLVIAEVPSWEVKSTVRIQYDPLIAGWVESTGQLFYITDYDLTPIESYFKDQFGFGVTIPPKKK